ncbi:PAS domain-containing protein [Kiloniella laminariae]|uniref:PAS domain-containing protein n=1 Tax=Kiloniella laminariae TaxID=454162 RepID=A0ABT4LHU9_9PROT|nr:PAS domain-containing protein [Kiloniella laminariae]MCZ4280676.1 PAS domain-containing protein [Kiloniella laminariae]
MYSEVELAGWDQRVRALYDYWISIHPREQEQSVLPGRQHFDPLDVPSLLRHIWLVDVSGNPTRFKFRLFGTTHVEAMRGDFTGQWIDEVFGDFKTSAVYGDYLLVADKGLPSYRKGPAGYHVPDYNTIERIMLPLSKNGQDVDMILALTVYL